VEDKSVEEYLLLNLLLRRISLLRSRDHLLLDSLLRRIRLLRSSMVLLGLLLWDMRLDMRLNLLRWLNRSRMMLLLDLLQQSRNDLWLLNLLWWLNRSRMMVLLNLLLWWRLHKSSKIVMLLTLLMWWRRLCRRSKSTRTGTTL
jgi:hypothetical protein